MEIEDKLKKIAEDYHKKCDEFDNKICSGKNKYGESIPIGIYETQLVNMNAKICFQNAYNFGIQFDFSQQDVLKAIQNFRS